MATAIPGHTGPTPIEWRHVLKGVLGVILFAPAIILMTSGFTVPGLQPPNGKCLPAVDVTNPASHTECDKMIDALRADAWIGLGLVLVTGFVLFVGNRLLRRFPNMRSTMFFVGMLLGIAIAVFVIPAISNMLDSWNMLGGVVWRAMVASTLVLVYFWCLAYWESKVTPAMGWLRERMAAAAATPSPTTGTTGGGPTTTT